MDDFINGEFKGKPALKKAFGEILKIAQGFVGKPDSMFEVKKYQVLLAAYLAASEAPRQALRLQAGGGKTFVILLLG